MGRGVEFLYSKKDKLNTQLYKAHLSAALEWGSLWPLIEDNIIQEYSTPHPTDSTASELQVVSTASFNNLRSVVHLRTPFVHCLPFSSTLLPIVLRCTLTPLTGRTHYVACRLPRSYAVILTPLTDLAPVHTRVQKIHTNYLRRITY